VYEASDGAVADAQESGGLLMAAALDGRHHDRLTLHLRQRRDMAERVAGAKRQAGLLAGAGDQGEGKRVERIVGVATSRPDRVDRGVVDDPVEPGTRLAHLRAT
jgi:hypothetical protein